MGGGQHEVAYNSSDLNKAKSPLIEPLTVEILSLDASTPKESLSVMSPATVFNSSNSATTRSQLGSTVIPSVSV